MYLLSLRNAKAINMKNQPSIPNNLLNDLQRIIDAGKQQAVIQVNSTLTLVYWQVGKRINEDVLQSERAAYGKQIVADIAAQLTKQYGQSFEVKNLRRMMQFAEVFPNFEIVVPAARQLSWSHFIILIPIKDAAKRAFYLQKASEGLWSKRELRRQIQRKVFERNEIAEIQVNDTELSTQHAFKDPYLLDFLDLQDGYSENDLETAILRDLEQFILELGTGFTFVERQKRIILDGVDFYLDLLFYHRKLKRLIVIELKLDKFKPAYKGQMELYLKWLDRYDRQEDENQPIGLILCAEASREQVELLQMHKDGIMVAEYWTELPPKEELERRLHEALIAARERLNRKRLDE